METIELGGQRFQIITNGPIKHDYWFLERVHAAGLDNLEWTAGETPSELVDAVLAKLLRSGHAMVILGGMIAPAELNLKDWTPEVAAHMTTMIEELMAPEDKLLVRGLVAKVLLGFFQSGLASLRISRTASATKPRAVGDESESGPKNAGA